MKLPTTDSGLADLAAQVAAEQRRRAIPAQIRQLVAEYEAVGGDVADLDLEPQARPTPERIGVPDPTGGVINPDQEASDVEAG